MIANTLKRSKAPRRRLHVPCKLLSCIARTEGAFPIKVFVLDVGRHRPLNIGVGAMAILSALPDDEIQRICLANQKKVEQGYPRYEAEPM